ncbi:MAG: O-sialoglycoprotein endopeptidase [Clostridia bacterium]|nr:O-sialoglycoprotein endopeptidase [Clostridia bacterium]MDD4571857.1 O-sialoglycoprotein endopeptidase [Clostridia bacterium]
MSVIIGIDTSCYTTSVAVIDLDGTKVAENRRLLAVEKGSRGISQSAALFQHIREGSDVIAQVLAQVNKNSVVAVAVSTAPRNLADSYMPVFLAGVNAAKILGAAYAVPIYCFSHQEGHIMAALVTAKMPKKQEFLAVHLSGGTSEILKVKTIPEGFEINILGAGTDLHAGQFVDRVGVALGLPFPAGVKLDELACSCKEDFTVIKVAVCGRDFSFSGPESAAQRLIAKGEKAEKVACATFDCIAKTLVKTLNSAMEHTGLQNILFSGGVSGSVYLKQKLEENLLKRAALYFAPPEYARDNALGIAYLGKKAYYDQHI